MLLALWIEVSGEKPMESCFQPFTRYPIADIACLIRINISI